VLEIKTIGERRRADSLQDRISRFQRHDSIDDAAGNRAVLRIHRGWIRTLLSTAG